MWTKTFQTKILQFWTKPSISMLMKSLLVEHIKRRIPHAIYLNDANVIHDNHRIHCNHHWPLQWRHNGIDGVSNHQPHHCLLSRLLGRRSKKTSKLCVTGLCARNSPGTGEFPAQMASNAEKVSIWWRHRDNFEKQGTLALGKSFRSYIHPFSHHGINAPRPGAPLTDRGKLWSQHR